MARYFSVSWELVSSTLSEHWEFFESWFLGFDLDGVVKSMNYKIKRIRTVELQLAVNHLVLVKVQMKILHEKIRQFRKLQNNDKFQANENF